jgi:hypothetical protein
VAVTGCKMSLCHTQGEVAVLMGNREQLNCHNILLLRLPYQRIP